MKNSYMEAAVELASLVTGEVPVAAVIVKNGEIISSAVNEMLSGKNAVLHAEMNAINKASAYLGQTYLTDCDIYVTKEPCLMCFGAVMHARIRRVYFGAYDIKYGACDHILSIIDKKKTNHYPEIYGGIMENECKKLLEDFFK